MFQPRVKLEFIRRYLPPAGGWQVYVDVDASEMGRTGGNYISEAALQSRRRMLHEGTAAIKALEKLGVQVGGSRARWHEQHGLPSVKGDRDVVAFHAATRRCLVAEVEGASSGQPEQKLYKAIGQLVIAVSEAHLPDGWEVGYVLVAYGEKIAGHLRRATALPRLGILALELVESGQNADVWTFGPPPLLRLAHRGITVY